MNAKSKQINLGIWSTYHENGIQCPKDRDCLSLPTAESQGSSLLLRAGAPLSVGTANWDLLFAVLGLGSSGTEQEGPVG